MKKNRTRRPEASGALATDRATPPSQAQLRDKYRTASSLFFLRRESTNRPRVRRTTASPPPYITSTSRPTPSHPSSGSKSIHPKQRRRRKEKEKREKSIRKHERAQDRRSFACEARPLRFDAGMDAFYSTSSAAASGWGYDSLKNFREISPAVQSHLKLVRALPYPPFSPLSSSICPTRINLGSVRGSRVSRTDATAGFCAGRRFGRVPREGIRSAGAVAMRSVLCCSLALDGSFPTDLAVWCSISRRIGFSPLDY